MERKGMIDIDFDFDLDIEIEIFERGGMFSVRRW